MLGTAADVFALDTANEHMDELIKRYSERYVREGVEKLKSGITGDDAARTTTEDVCVFPLSGLEHGLFEGLWNIGREKNTGFVIDGKAIPVTQFALEMSEFKDVNPYEQKCSAVLFVAGPEDASVPQNAVKIGQLTKEKSKIIRGFAEEKDGTVSERNLNRPGSNQ